MVHFTYQGSRLAGSVRRWVKDILTPRFGPIEAGAMTDLMFSHVMGWDRTRSIVNSDRELSEYAMDQLTRILDRVMNGEPLQYVVGKCRFYGMDFEVNPSVLIPRVETEELVECIVRECDSRTDLRVLDIGTGSGAIAVALARNLRWPSVTALDVSAEALETARRNATRYKTKIDFLHADVMTWEPKPGSWDVIVSNPPYVTESERIEMERHVTDHEPSLALFVPDENPLLFYTRIAGIAMKGLVNGGRLYFEINPRFAGALEQMLLAEGFEQVNVINDLSGKQRIAVAEKRKD